MLNAYSDYFGIRKTYVYTEKNMTALIAYLACINLSTFFLFYLDKRRARRGAWRIPEKMLLGFCSAGGAAGGLLAMHVTHHKTRKPAFKFGVPVLLMAWIAGLAHLYLRF